MARRTGCAPANSTSRALASAVAASCSASVRSVIRRAAAHTDSTTGTVASTASAIRQSKHSRNTKIVAGVTTEAIRVCARLTARTTVPTPRPSSWVNWPARPPSNQPSGSTTTWSPIRVYSARRQADDSRSARVAIS